MKYHNGMQSISFCYLKTITLQEKNKCLNTNINIKEPKKGKKKTKDKTTYCNVGNHNEGSWR